MKIKDVFEEKESKIQQKTVNGLHVKKPIKEMVAGEIVKKENGKYEKVTKVLQSEDGGLIVGFIEL